CHITRACDLTYCYLSNYTGISVLRPSITQPSTPLPDNIMSDMSIDQPQAFFSVNPVNTQPTNPVNAPPPLTIEQVQQLIAAYHGQHAGQQQSTSTIKDARPSKPTRYDGTLGTDPTVWLFQFNQYADITNVP